MPKTSRPPARAEAPRAAARAALAAAALLVSAALRVPPAAAQPAGAPRRGSPTPTVAPSPTPGAVVPPRPAPAPGLDVEAYVALLRAALPSSPTLRALDARRAAAAEIEVAAREEAPWTLRGGLRHAQPFPRTGVVRDPVTMETAPTARSWDLTGRAGVEYRRRSTLLAAATADVGYADPAPREVISAHDLPFAIGLSVAYDLVTGGAESPANDRAHAAEARAVAEALAADAARVDAELRLVDDALAAFAGACKARAIQDLQRVVTEAAAASRAQLAARISSEADALNFRVLEQLYAARLASAAQERRVALERLTAWGPDLSALGRARAADALTCRVPSAELAARAARRPAGDDARRRLVEGSPLVLARAAELTAAALVLRATETELRPTVAPFLAGSVARLRGLDETVFTAQAGLDVSWTIPELKGAASVRGQTEALSAARRRVEEARAALDATARALIARLETERALLAALDDTTATTTQLARVLEVQRAIGDVDALNQATALVNAVDLELAGIDALARFTSAALQLDVLAAASRAE
jgi:hypothetical protein